MEINKTRPKFHFLTKIETKISHFVFFLLFTDFLLLEPFQNLIRR